MTRRNLLIGCFATAISACILLIYVNTKNPSKENTSAPDDFAELRINSAQAPVSVPSFSNLSSDTREIDSFKDPTESLNVIKRRFESIIDNHLPASDYLKLISLCKDHIKRWPTGPETEWVRRISADCYSALGKPAESTAAFLAANAAGGTRLSEHSLRKNGDAELANEVRINAEISSLRDEIAKHFSRRDFTRVASLTQELKKYGKMGEGYAHAVNGSIKLAQIKYEEAQSEFESALNCGIREPEIYESLANAINITEKQIPVWERMIRDLNNPSADLQGSMRIGMCYYFMGSANKTSAAVNFKKAADKFQYVVNNYPGSDCADEAKSFLLKSLSATVK